MCVRASIVIRFVSDFVLIHSDMVSKQKPNSCALKEKLETLERLDNDKSITQLSIKFGVGKANIRLISGRLISDHS